MKTKTPNDRGKAVNAGPRRGDNSVPASRKRAPNTSSLGGGGAGGDARSIPAATARRATRGPAAG